MFQWVFSYKKLCIAFLVISVASTLATFCLAATVAYLLWNPNNSGSKFDYYPIPHVSKADLRSVAFDQRQREIIAKIGRSTNEWKAEYNPSAYLPFAELEPEPKENQKKTALEILIEMRYLYADFIRVTLEREHELLRAINETDIPVKFDARLRWPLCFSVHQVWDQAACGSCARLSMTTSVSDRMCIQTNGRTQVTLSVQDLLECCPDCLGTCKGSPSPMEPWLHWLNYGLVSGGPFGSGYGCKPYPHPPGCGHPCSGLHYNRATTGACQRRCSDGRSYEGDKHYGASFYALGNHRHFSLLRRFLIYANNDPATHRAVWRDQFDQLRNLNISTPQRTGDPTHEQTVQMVQVEILQRGPVQACYNVMEDFIHYKSGVYSYVAGDLVFAHCVRIIGWGNTSAGVPYWLAVNSWGRDWGDKGGLFRLHRDAGLSRRAGRSTQLPSIRFMAGVPRL